MNRRVGFVGIIVKERSKAGELVNRILSAHGDMIVGRMGVPYRDRKCSVITLIVDATTDDVGTLTGKLGMIPDVSVKSALSSI